MSLLLKRRFAQKFDKITAQEFKRFTSGSRASLKNVAGLAPFNLSAHLKGCFLFLLCTKVRRFLMEQNSLFFFYTLRQPWADLPSIIVDGGNEQAVRFQLSILIGKDMLFLCFFAFDYGWLKCTLGNPGALIWSVELFVLTNLADMGQKVSVCTNFFRVCDVHLRSLKRYSFRGPHSFC